MGMLALINKNKQEKKDKYELLASVKITDVKGYLQKEYDRASEREDLIKDLEKEIARLKEIEIKYGALLVVQEKTQERIEKQDSRIKELKETINDYQDRLKLSNSKNTDIRINAENKLKEKDNEIKDLKQQIKELTTKKRGRK